MTEPDYREVDRIVRHQRVGDDWLPSVTTIEIAADPNPMMPRFRLWPLRRSLRLSNAGSLPRDPENSTGPHAEETS